MIALEQKIIQVINTITFNEILNGKQYGNMFATICDMRRAKVIFPSTVIWHLRLSL